MEITQAHQELDEQLPADLRDTIAIAETNITSPVSEDSAMNGTNATPAPAAVSEQVLETARAEVQRIFKDKDSQTQVAVMVEKYINEAGRATASLAAKEKELATANDELTKLRGKQTQENPTVTGADTDSSKWHGEKDKAYAALHDKIKVLETALAASNKEKMDYACKAKKADRDDKMDKAKIKSDKFKKRATASKEDGNLAMSDEDFEAAMAEFIEQAGEAQPAAAADGGGTPVPAPKDKSGPADKQKVPSLTGKSKEGGSPVPAPKVGAGPAEKQKHAKMAHASDATAPVEGEPAAQEGAATPEPEAGAAPADGETATQANAEAIPAAPDLTTADIMAHSTAAMLVSGPPASSSGKSAYAKAFGI